MFEKNNETNTAANAVKRKPQKKITPQRLKNIGLYYLKRFESSVENLRTVLQRRVEAFARENPEFNKSEAMKWIEDVLVDFQRLHYLDDKRYTDIKVRGYLAAGKPARYIAQKLRAKGIDECQIAEVLENTEYDPLQMALKLAKRKKIGPYRLDEEQRKMNRQKDMGVLVRAGFDYDIASEVLNSELPEEDIVF